MLARDYVITAQNHEEVHPIPFWLGFHDDIARRMDGHFVNQSA